MNNIINQDYLNNFNNDFEKFFYQMTMAIKKYISINNINDEIFSLISQLIDKITDFINVNADESEKSFKNKILRLESKLLGLLHDILNLFCQDSEYSYYVMNKYIAIFYNLLIQGKLDDLFIIEFIDEFLSLSIIFENNMSFFKKKEDKIALQTIYEDFLIKLLKKTAFLSQQKSSINLPKIEVQRKSIFGLIKKTKSSDEKIKEENVEINNEYLNHYIEITFKKEKFPNVFFSL